MNIRWENSQGGFLERSSSFMNRCVFVLSVIDSIEGFSPQQKHTFPVVRHEILDLLGLITYFMYNLCPIILKI